jgi:hypothetical protein
MLSLWVRYRWFSRALKVALLNKGRPITHLFKSDILTVSLLFLFVYSVADPRYLSQILDPDFFIPGPRSVFSIPDPDFSIPDPGV